MIRIFLSCVAAMVLFYGSLGPAISEAADKKIAIMSVGPSPAVQNAVRGFLPRLKELAPDVKVTLKIGLEDMNVERKSFENWNPIWTRSPFSGVTDASSLRRQTRKSRVLWG